MTRLKVVEEIQDGGSPVRRKTTILRLIFVSKIKSKRSFIGFKEFFKSLFVVQNNFFIPARKINSIISHLCHRSHVIEIHKWGRKRVKNRRTGH